MKVAVLCGGFGTRLGELTRDLPKPMLPIGGRPYLERVLESFADCGLREFVLLTGHLAEVIESHFADGARFGYTIQYSREASRSAPAARCAMRVRCSAIASFSPSATCCAASTTIGSCSST